MPASLLQQLLWHVQRYNSCVNWLLAAAAAAAVAVATPAADVAAAAAATPAERPTRTQSLGSGAGAAGFSFSPHSSLNSSVRVGYTSHAPGAAAQATVCVGLFSALSESNMAIMLLQQSLDAKGQEQTDAIINEERACIHNVAQCLAEHSVHLSHQRLLRELPTEPSSWPHAPQTRPGPRQSRRWAGLAPVDTHQHVRRARACRELLAARCCLCCRQTRFAELRRRHLH
jgi:hypothetical protein